jgi:hypothetical protein
MSSTVANYISNIPTTDPAYAIGQQVQTAITEAGSTANVAAANRARQDLPSLMQQLLNALIERHKLPPATLLAIAVALAPTGGHVLADCGVAGSVTISGGALTVTPGAY